jgi:tetratricopeptide (TPR) repeat protein
VAALLLIVNVNVRTVQADTYYKQGLAYEGSGAWDGSIVLYREAALRQPEEDFYYLFLGRSLLQYSTMTPVTGTATLPADLTHVPTSELLPLTERALRARNREDVLRGANAALTAAQRLNPLNTDHAANLARLNRSWAFVNALGPNEGPSNALLRQIVATRPKDVDMAKLSAALTYYRQSTMLSPQNAQLQNEMASVQFVMGDTAGALQTLAHSLELDSIFTQTYLLRGDLLATGGDKAGALADYRAVALIAPDDISVQSAVGVYSAQTGDNEGSLAAFRKITEVETAALASAQAQQRDLEAQVNRSGGYSMLLGSATGRRDALQGAIASHRSQLHLAYRNMALVQRDMGRLQDALTTARIALTHASDSERPTTDALIADIQKRLSGG